MQTGGATTIKVRFLHRQISDVHYQWVHSRLIDNKGIWSSIHIDNFAKTGEVDSTQNAHLRHPTFIRIRATLRSTKQSR